MLPPDTTAVTASTGCAASPLHGQTLHAFAGIGIAKKTTEQAIKSIKARKILLRSWKSVRKKIIHENLKNAVHKPILHFLIPWNSWKRPCWCKKGRFLKFRILMQEGSIPGVMILAQKPSFPLIYDFRAIEVDSRNLGFYCKKGRFLQLRPTLPQKYHKNNFKIF